MNQITLAKDDLKFLKYTHLMNEGSYVDFLNMLIGLWKEPEFAYMEDDIEDFAVVEQLRENPSAFVLGMAAMNFYPELHFYYSKNREDSVDHYTIMYDLEEMEEEDALDAHIERMNDILSQNSGGGKYGAVSYDGTEIDLCLDIVRLLNRFNYSYYMDNKEEGSFAGSASGLQIMKLCNAPVSEVW